MDEFFIGFSCDFISVLRNRFYKRDCLFAVFWRSWLLKREGDVCFLSLKIPQSNLALAHVQKSVQKKERENDRGPSKRFKIGEKHHNGESDEKNVAQPRRESHEKLSSVREIKTWFLKIYLHII